MVNLVDLVLADKALEQILVEDIAHNRRGAAANQPIIEWLDVHGDDSFTAVLLEVLDQAVTDLTVRSRNQGNGLSHPSSSRWKVHQYGFASF
jgi:hypothetical protein